MAIQTVSSLSYQFYWTDPEHKDSVTTYPWACLQYILTTAQSHSRTFLVLLSKVQKFSQPQSLSYKLQTHCGICLDENASRNPAGLSIRFATRLGPGQFRCSISTTSTIRMDPYHRLAPLISLVSTCSRRAVSTSSRSSKRATGTPSCVTKSVRATGCESGVCRARVGLVPGRGPASYRPATVVGPARVRLGVTRSYTRCIGCQRI